MFRNTKDKNKRGMRLRKRQGWGEECIDFRREADWGRGKWEGVQQAALKTTQSKNKMARTNKSENTETQKHVHTILEQVDNMKLIFQTKNMTVLNLTNMRSYKGV